MSVARVYRPVTNWRGDRAGDLEDFYQGDVTGVIIGGAVPQGYGRFPGVVSTESQVGIPFQQDSGVTVQKNDFLSIGNVLFKVVGPRQWDEAHEFAGTDILDDMYWVQVEASHGGA